MEIYRGKRVLVTGHTGFKGAWLTLWLQKMGAHVIGYSLSPKQEPNLFDVCDLGGKIDHHIGDIRDMDHFHRVVKESQPEIIFHLAAQAIVLDSYKEPRETFDTNVMGTVNVLEASRQEPCVKGVVVITTDKVYDNQEWIWGYREGDTLGGHDPYSASKAAAELVASSYRRSFCSDENTALIATARAGNVVGGGDFSDFRLVPDCMRALEKGEPIVVRNPNSVRPWLYVLDALHGYLMLGEKLLQGDSSFADAWNLGPWENPGVACEELVQLCVEKWGSGEYRIEKQVNAPKEMNLLRLNWDKALQVLGWSPKYRVAEAIEAITDWHKGYASQPTEMVNLCQQQIEQFENQDTQHALYRNSLEGCLSY